MHILEMLPAIHRLRSFMSIRKTGSRAVSVSFFCAHIYLLDRKAHVIGWDVFAAFRHHLRIRTIPLPNCSVLKKLNSLWNCIIVFFSMFWANDSLSRRGCGGSAVWNVKLALKDALAWSKSKSIGRLEFGLPLLLTQHSCFIKTPFLFERRTWHWATFSKHARA